MSTTTRRYCRCGASAAATSSPPALAAGVIEVWEQRHTGAGHGPATARQAAAARRRAESAASMFGASDPDECC